jgi:predicted dehydrogenase
MIRRDFLKLASTLVAVPYFIPSRVLGRDGATAPSNRVNVGVIGLGGMGMGHLRNNLLSNDRIRVVALCDVDRRPLEVAKGNVETAYAAEIQSGSYHGVFMTGDYRELIARPEVDAVLIAVPDHWHAIPFIAAAKAGKDIYSEKPLALTIPEGQAMVRAVESYGTICQIGSMQRSSPEFIRCVELARNGYLGTIKRVVVGLGHSKAPQFSSTSIVETPPPELNYEMWLGPAPEQPYIPARTHWHWRWFYDFSGGQLTDWIGHHYDIGAWAANLTHTGPVAIRKAKAVFNTGPVFNTAEVFSFEAHYANGVVFDVSSENRMGVRIEGSEGWVWATRGKIEHSSPQLRALRVPAAGSFATGAPSHMDNLLDCIHSRRTPVCPVQEAHRVVTVGHLANAAFRSGREELSWDPLAEKVIGAPDAERFLSRTYRGPWQLPS